MNILLCFPSAGEEELFRSQELGEGDFYWEDAELRHSRFQLSIVRSGIGKTETSYHLTHQLMQQSVDLVFLLGVAGGSPDLALGSAHVVPQQVEIDLGAWEDGLFRSVFDLGLESADHFPYSAGVLQTEMPQQYWGSQSQHKGVTVSSIVDDPEWSAARLDLAQAQIESMEGSAFYYTSKMLCIPSLEIRGISNHLGIRDKAEWKIPEAMQAASRMLFQILKNIHDDL